MDLSNSIEPDSTQLNAEDFLSGPHTYTVTEVSAGSSEQPVNIYLAETDRAYRPSKSMRRVLVAAWGKDASAYAGRRLTLYRDPEVTFGRDRVGGIKISHLSHIDKKQQVALTVTRGKRAPHTVDPLPELSKVDQLRAEWQHADADRRAEIQAEVAALTEQPADVSDAEGQETGQ